MSGRLTTPTGWGRTSGRGAASRSPRHRSFTSRRSTSPAVASKVKRKDRRTAGSLVIPSRWAEREADMLCLAGILVPDLFKLWTLTKIDVSNNRLVGE